MNMKYLRSALISLLILGGNLAFPSPALAQIRNPAWLSAGSNQDTEFYVDINNIRRNNIRAQVQILVFSNRASNNERRQPVYRILLEDIDCQNNSITLRASTEYDQNGVVLEQHNFGYSPPDPVFPGSIAATYFNIACFPRSDMVSPTDEMVAEALRNRRGLDLSGRPLFEKGTIVLFTNFAFGIATDSGYEVISQPDELPAVDAIPRGLSIMDTSGRFLIFDGTGWVTDDEKRERVSRPQNRELEIGFIDRSAYVYVRGWRPLIWPTSQVYQNGDFEIFENGVATFWSGQFWYGYVTSNTQTLVRSWRERM